MKSYTNRGIYDGATGDYFEGHFKGDIDDDGGLALGLLKKTQAWVATLPGDKATLPDLITDVYQNSDFGSLSQAATDTDAVHTLTCSVTSAGALMVSDNYKQDPDTAVSDVYRAPAPMTVRGRRCTWKAR